MRPRPQRAAPRTPGNRWPAICSRLCTAASVGPERRTTRSCMLSRWQVQGDAVTLRPATQALWSTHGLGWWRAHRLLAIVLVTMLALVGAWAGWVALGGRDQRAAGGLCSLAAADRTGYATGNAGGRGRARTGGTDRFRHARWPRSLPPRREPPPTRVATRRDQVYWRRTVTVLALTASVSLGWAVGLFGGVMIRVLFGALAVLTLVFLAWQ